MFPIVLSHPNTLHGHIVEQYLVTGVYLLEINSEKVTGSYFLFSSAEVPQVQKLLPALTGSHAHNQITL